MERRSFRKWNLSSENDEMEKHRTDLAMRCLQYHAN